MSKVSYIISNSGNINMIVDGESYTVAVDHANYSEIVERLTNKDYENIVDLLDVAKSIVQVSQGKVAVLDGCVTYDGREVINPLTERILAFVKGGLPFEPMLRFLENLMQNPSRTSIQELYLFLENNTLPITEDGCFLAYRKVDNEYRSFHQNPDGTYNTNKVGDVVSQERNQVDDQRDNVCSNGLHFCSLSYLPAYHGGNGRVMIVKINPKDVVSIPSDYNNAKGRCCLYEVVGEHTDPDKEYKDAFDQPVYASDGSDYGWDDDEDETRCEDCGLDLCDCICDDVRASHTVSGGDLGVKPNGHRYHNKRDASGRFMPRS